MTEPFVLRALAAAIGLALVAAPLGCVVVWQRMAYLGETVAQASLVGVALSLAFRADVTAGVLLVAAATAGIVVLLGRQRLVPVDSILGLLHHASLALGVIALSLLKGPPVDLVGYLFGDIFAVTSRDLLWIWGGGAVVVALMAWLWPSLLRLSLNEDLAAAEGVSTARTRLIFTLLLALTIAVAIKIVGALLVIAFLIVPAVAARPMSATPERMMLLTALIAAAGSVGGIGASLNADIPGGPAIVLAMALLAAGSMAVTALGRRGGSA